MYPTILLSFINSLKIITKIVCFIRNFLCFLLFLKKILMGEGSVKMHKEPLNLLMQWKVYENVEFLSLRDRNNELLLVPKIR